MYSNAFGEQRLPNLGLLYSRLFCAKERIRAKKILLQNICEIQGNFYFAVSKLKR